MTQIAFCPPLKGVRGMAFMNLIIDFVSNLSLSFLIFYFLTASQERGGYVNILKRTHARLVLHRRALKQNNFSSGTGRASRAYKSLKQHPQRIFQHALQRV